MRAAFSTERTEDDYLATIEGKTAALMSTSCRIGALTGGLPRTEVDALTDFGRCFGMLFQLRDDILDVIATDEELGKPAGQDLAEGIYTLPVLLALRDPDTGPELRPLLGQPARPARAGQGAFHRGAVRRHRTTTVAAVAALRRRRPSTRGRRRAPSATARPRPRRSWRGRCSRDCPSRGSLARLGSVSARGVSARGAGWGRR